MADEYAGKAKVAKIDIETDDATKQIAIQYGVQGIPALMMFKDGEKVAKAKFNKEGSDVYQLKLAEKKKKNAADSRKRKQLSQNSKNDSRRSRKNKPKKSAWKQKRLPKRLDLLQNVMQQLKQSVMQKKQHDKQNLLLLRNNALLKSVQPKKKRHWSDARQHHVHSRNFEHVLSVKVLGLRTFRFH